MSCNLRAATATLGINIGIIRTKVAKPNTSSETSIIPKRKPAIKKYIKKNIKKNQNSGFDALPLNLANFDKQILTASMNPIIKIINLLKNYNKLIY